MVLLAALLHVLDCAHGPTAAQAGRADSLLPASPVSCAQPAQRSPQTTARQTAPAHDREVHCCGLDEPTLQPPRDVVPAAPVLHDAPPAEPSGAQSPPTFPTGQPSQLPTGPSSPGRARACLGVWRT